MKPKRVTIIGAGLPGLCTAISLSKRAGRSAEVYLFEDHPQIGEELSGDACSSAFFDIIRERLYVTPQESWKAGEFKKIQVYFPKKNALGIERKDVDIEGAIINKTKVEKNLAGIAKKMGVALQTNHKFVAGKRNGSLGFKIKVHDGTNMKDEHYKTDVLICADGYGSAVASRTGLLSGKFMRNMWMPSMDYGLQVRLRGDFSKICNEESLVIKFAGDRPGGEYFYIFPKNPGEANVGYVSVYENVRFTEDTLQRWLNTHSLNGYEILEKRGKFVPGHGPLFKPYWDRAAAVGDAAAQVEPTFRGGIRIGAEAGCILGEVLAESCLENDLSEQKLGEYHARIQKANLSLNHVKDLRMTKEIIEKVCSNKTIEPYEVEAMNQNFDLIRQYGV